MGALYYRSTIYQEGENCCQEASWMIASPGGKWDFDNTRPSSCGDHAPIGTDVPRPDELAYTFKTAIDNLWNSVGCLKTIDGTLMRLDHNGEWYQAQD